MVHEVRGASAPHFHRFWRALSAPVCIMRLMPPLVIPDGFGQARVAVHDVTGHTCISEMGFAYVTQPIQSEVNSLSTAWGVPLKAMLNGGSTYLGITVDWRNAGVLHRLTSVTSSGVGGAGAALAAPQVQGLAVKRTGLVGRQFIGRMFFQDQQEAQVGDLGALTPTGQATIQAICTGIQNGFTANLWNEMLLHHDATAPTQIVSFTASPTVATLRRRFPR